MYCGYGEFTLHQYVLQFFVLAVNHYGVLNNELFGVKIIVEDIKVML